MMHFLNLFLYRFILLFVFLLYSQDVLLYAINNMLRQCQKFKTIKNPAITCYVHDSGSVVVEVCRAFCCSVLTLIIVETNKVLLFLQFVSVEAAQYVCSQGSFDFEDSYLTFKQIFKENLSMCKVPSLEGSLPREKLPTCKVEVLGLPLEFSQVSDLLLCDYSLIDTNMRYICSCVFPSMFPGCFALCSEQPVEAEQEIQFK
jgi:hypothetical protein